MKNTLKLVPIMVVLSVTSVFAADWPWLYGPRRNHTSDQKGLLRAWPPEGPKVLWTVPLGAGCRQVILVPLAPPPEEICWGADATGAGLLNAAAAVAATP